MNTGRERKMPGRAYLGVPAWLVAAAVLHAAACGGDASNGSGGTGFEGADSEGADSEGADSEGPALALPPVVIPSRAEVPAEAPGTASEPDPVRAILDDLPEQLDTEQFDILLDHYCLTCHATPACSASCDGFFFDSWADLAAGADSERVLERTIGRINDGSMPPPTTQLVDPLPSAPRERMVDFIRDALGGR
jgi:hypothetical protein